MYDVPLLYLREICKMDGIVVIACATGYFDRFAIVLNFNF